MGETMSMDDRSLELLKHLNRINLLVETHINICKTNEEISDLIGVLETTTITAYDKRETIKEQE